MNRIEKLEKLSDDELIIKVAEAQGWKVIEEEDFFGQKSKKVIFRLVGPKRDPVTEYSARNYGWSKLSDWIDFLPKYERPANYMALMQEIWQESPGTYINAGILMLNPQGNTKYLFYGKEGDKISCLWRAICIAWLVVCGGEK